MAENTLGRRIEEFGEAMAQNEKQDPPELKILGKTYPLRAKVEKIGGFSAHGDKHELESIITKSNLRIKKIAVVHGEASQSAAFAQTLRSRGHDVVVPKSGDVLPF